MTAPLIGVTTHRVAGANGQTDQYATPLSYLDPISAAGGVPLLLSASLSNEQLRRAFERLDGLLLTGGGDIDPLLFGGRPHPRVYGIDPERDRSEIALTRLAAEAGLPFLGICRGAQVINVALGGTLYTDIGDQLPGACRHDRYTTGEPRDLIAHEVQVLPGSRLEGILGCAGCGVNSLHHQGLERIASGLQVTAYAPDGLVEAVELAGHPFGLGVQWHPEWLQALAPQRALFAAFIQAAGGKKE